MVIAASPQNLEWVTEEEEKNGIESHNINAKRTQIGIVRLHETLQCVCVCRCAGVARVAPAVAIALSMERELNRIP